MAKGYPMKENISKYGIPLYINGFDLIHGALNGTFKDTDFDDDGIPNDIETALLLDPGNPDDAWRDFDNDGLMNKVEIDIHHDPFSS